jgi:hypothetical protein
MSSGAIKIKWNELCDNCKMENLSTIEQLKQRCNDCLEKITLSKSNLTPSISAAHEHGKPVTKGPVLIIGDNELKEVSQNSNEFNDLLFFNFHPNFTLSQVVANLEFYLPEQELEAYPFVMVILLGENNCKLSNYSTLIQYLHDAIPTTSYFGVYSKNQEIISQARQGDAIYFYSSEMSITQFLQQVLESL